METESIPRYMRIAMSIASRITDGEFQENTRISGRSTLSSEYQVSPETVRKALNLLADMDIVRTVEGSGTIVLSAEKAEKYLETVSVRGEQSDLHSRLQGLLREYTRISRQIYDVGARLIAAGTSPLPSEKTLPNYEVRVPDDSDKIGMSIGDLRFWQCTGASIVAVRRGQSVTVSPGPYLELRAGDVLAVFALIAGTATTFSVATPLLANCITALFGGTVTKWISILILLPMALLFSEGSMNNLQTVSIIAAFPIGLAIILIIAGFINDAKDYLRE